MISSQDISPIMFIEYKVALLKTYSLFRCACFVNIASFISYYCDFATNLNSGDIFIFYKETSALSLGPLSFSPIELNLIARSG